MSDRVSFGDWFKSTLAFAGGFFAFHGYAKASWNAPTPPRDFIIIGIGIILLGWAAVLKPIAWDVRNFYLRSFTQTEPLPKNIRDILLIQSDVIWSRKTTSRYDYYVGEVINNSNYAISNIRVDCYSITPEGQNEVHEWVGMIKPGESKNFRIEDRLNDSERSIMRFCQLESASPVDSWWSGAKSFG